MTVAVEGWRRARVAAGFVLAGCLSVSSASADDKGDQAERLFREGTAALDASRYEEACAKLEESQKLDPALGTQYNLALCHKNAGRAAVAYRLFAEVATAARAAGKAERERASRGKMAELEPLLGRVTLRTSAIALAHGAEIKLRSETIPRERWAEPRVVEPGRISVQVSAPGYEPWETKIDVKAGAGVDVEVKVGARIASASAPSPAPAPQRDEPSGDSQRVLALVVGGIGVIGIGVGTAFGVVSMSRRSEAREICEVPNPCGDEQAAQKWTAATTAGTVSTVAFIAGGAALAGGAVLWFTAPSPSKSRGALRWAPQVGPHAAGIVLRGEL